MKRKRPEGRSPDAAGRAGAMTGAAGHAAPAHARPAAAGSAGSAGAMAAKRAAGRAAPAPLPDDVTRRGAIALIVVLAVAALGRAVFAFVPSMALWGLGLLRFVAPAPGWALWALAALALVPAFARRVAPALERAGDGIARTPGAAGAAAGLVAAIAVLAAPDRLQFVGDYLVRLGAARGEVSTALVFPQALPLDLFLHYTLPVTLARQFGIDPNDWSRFLGAAEAALLAMLGVAFARVLRLRGAAALAVAAAVTLNGALGLFTGFGKAFSELCVIAAAVAVFGTAAVAEGRGLLALSLVVCAGFTLHRSALVFVPALVVVWASWLRAFGGNGAWRRPANLAALALPPLTLGIMLPRIRAAMASVDQRMVASEGADLAHVLAAAFRPHHLFDLANMILLLAPLAPVALALAPLFAPSLRRRAEVPVLLALVLPLLALMLFVHPLQGVFRDYDVFAAGLVAISIAAAWLVGETLRGGAGRAWLAAAVAAGALAPSAQWLIHNHDTDRGLRRVEAYLAGPPARPPDERGVLLGYLGARYLALDRMDECAAAYARAAALTPSPRMLFEWALVESRRGNHRKAQEILERMVARAPEMPTAWLALGLASLQAGDSAECRRAARRALEIRPGLERARALLNAATPRESVPVAPAR